MLRIAKQQVNNIKNNTSAKCNSNTVLSNTFNSSIVILI